MTFLKTYISRCRSAYDLVYNAPHEVIERGNCQAIFLRNGHNVEVFVAGTNDVEDVVQAAQFCGRRNRHLGFYSHSLRIKKAIEKRIGKKDHVTITGHSLGGVTAQYLSLDLAGYCHGVMVNSVAAPKGFRTPFRLPESVVWNLVTNDLDMIPDYPILKPFDWLKMSKLNQTSFHYVQIRNRAKGYSFSQRVRHVIGPQLCTLAPITNSYASIARFHSLDHYEDLANG